MTVIEKPARRHHRRGEAPDWRDYLYACERPDVEALELNAQQLDEKRRKLSYELNLIRNRCLQRRRQALLAGRGRCE